LTISGSVLLYPVQEQPLRSVAFSVNNDMVTAYERPAKTERRIEPKPFVKWAGGKSQLLPELVKRVPPKYERYFEPFAGGAALFFHLQPPNASLVDANENLVKTYRVIKDQVEDLMDDLKRHIYDSDYYYGIRQVDRTDAYQGWSDVQKASRLIYLNKTCYNGLYRVNARGEFNTPFGRYTNPTILDEGNLRACSHALRHTQLIAGAFSSVEKNITSKDFVYFDPPYEPLSATANFTGYSQGGFDASKQEDLKNFCDRLNQKGVRFMLSNSSAPLILELYRSYKIEFVFASRTINSKTKDRGKIPEVIVTNY
jgi:DNA adenine methylase